MHEPHHMPSHEETEAAENACLYALDELNLTHALMSCTTILVNSLPGEFEQSRLDILEKALDDVIKEAVSAVVGLSTTEDPDFTDGLRIGLRLMRRVSTGHIPVLLAAAMGSPQVGKLKDLYEAVGVPLPKGVTEDSMFIAQRFNGRDFDNAGDFIDYARNGMTDAERETFAETLRNPESEDGPLSVHWSEDGVGTLIGNTPVGSTHSDPDSRSTGGESVEDRLRDAGIL